MVSGCSHIPFIRGEPVYDTFHTRVLMETIQKENALPAAGKGLGRFSMTRENEMLTNRIAYIFEKPDKMRISMLTPLGTPGLTFSADGKRVYFQSPDRQKVKTFSTKNPELTPFLDVQIRTSEVITSISGGVPVLPFYSARIEPKEDSPYVRYVLCNFFGGIREEIFADAKGVVREARVYDTQGSLRYKLIRKGDIQDHGGVGIPELISIEKDQDNQFSISVSRFMEEDGIEDFRFQIEKPETAKDQE